MDFAVTLFFAAFLTFSKDYGGVAILLLPLLAWARAANVRGAMRPLVLPLVVVVAAYAGARAWVSPAKPHGLYEPRVDARVFVKKSIQGATTLANVSLFETEGRTGARGVTRLVWRDGSRNGRVAEGIALLAMIAFLFAILARAKPPLALVVFCAAWCVLFFAPTLLTRNEQLYYHNDLVAAVAVLLGAAAARAWRPLTVAVLVVLFVNAEVSQRAMHYTWYELSEALRPLERYRTAPVDSLVFITDDQAKWDFALRADGQAPFVQTLFGRPDLQVRVFDRRAFRGEAGALVIDVDLWSAEAMPPHS